MKDKKRGKLVLYSGASGVGKGTILSRVMEKNPNVRLSVSNTTRAPRDGEKDGIHYSFISAEEFKKLIEEDGYLEYAEYCGNLYGTPVSQVERMLDEGYDVVLEIEVQGGLQVMEKYPEITSIFIIPPSLEVLEQRLRGRGTEDEETVLERLAQAKLEMQVKDKYKHIVINDDIDDAVDKVIKIISEENNNA